MMRNVENPCKFWIPTFELGDLKWKNKGMFQAVIANPVGDWFGGHPSPSRIHLTK
jgi:hypothetical protein